MKTEHWLPVVGYEGLYEISRWGLVWSIKHSKVLSPYSDDGYLKINLYKNAQRKAFRVQALTRGDGKTGEDITANVKTIPDVPLQLPLGIWHGSDLEIRGEIYMENAALAEFNKTQKKPISNTRSAVAGSIKLKDSRECAKRPLRFFVHTFVASADPAPFDSHSQFYAWCSTVGFRVDGHYMVCPTIADVLRRCDELYSEGLVEISNLPFETDGAVIKLNKFKSRDEVGASSVAPLWALAHKVQKWEAETEVNGIDWCVGSSGAVTPRLWVKPVNIDNTIVQKMSLSNVSNLKRYNVRMHDTVKVEKAGKIIPRLVCVIKSKGGDAFDIPTECPVCGASTVIEQGGYNDDGTVVETLFCTNDDCPAKISRKIQKAVSRKVLNIDGIGESTIDALVEAGHVETFLDLYRLTEDVLLTLPRSGKNLAKKIIANIQAKKRVPLAKFLHAINVPNTGERVCEKLASHFKTLDAVFQATRPQLLQSGVGEHVANVFLNWLGEDWYGEVWAKFAPYAAEIGFVVEDYTANTVAPDSQKLAGKVIVVTGTLSRPRNQIQALIEANGGVVGSSITGKTTHLLAGEDCGSKLVKAQKTGIPVLTEAEFDAMIG